MNTLHIIGATLEALALEAMAMALVEDDSCIGFSDGNVIF